MNCCNVVFDASDGVTSASGSLRSFLSVCCLVLTCKGWPLQIIKLSPGLEGCNPDFRMPELQIQLIKVWHTSECQNYNQ